MRLGNATLNSGVLSPERIKFCKKFAVPILCQKIFRRKGFITVFAGIAQFERDLIRELTGGSKTAWRSFWTAAQAQYRSGASCRATDRGRQVSSRHRKDIQRPRGKPSIGWLLLPTFRARAASVAMREFMRMPSRFISAIRRPPSVDPRDTRSHNDLDDSSTATVST
jgi:hypothetical protein